MTTPETQKRTLSDAMHRIPRRPHAWVWLVLGSQLAVAALWWQLGWKVGLAAMFASHLLLLWGVMVPQSRLYGPVLSRLPTREKMVWLTVDDGPSHETAALLDLLDRYPRAATFFLVADRAAARPELTREILRRGHGIGNHSRSHPQACFWALGPRRMAAEIGATQDALRDITGVAPRWFRAVVGMANPFVAAPLRRHGLARVAWSGARLRRRARRIGAGGRAHRRPAASRRDRAASTRARRMATTWPSSKACCRRCRRAITAPCCRRICRSDVSREAFSSTTNTSRLTSLLHRSRSPYTALQERLATISQLLNGVLPYSGAKLLCRPRRRAARASRRRRGSTSGATASSRSGSRAGR